MLALYVLCVVGQSLLKLIWGDELFTLYIARTGSLPAIWRALAAGADPNPPLIHASVLLSTRLFGVHALALRLPSILYVGVALVSMWSVLRRWVAPGFAAVGLLTFMATRGFDYSYDARSYAPMMAWSMVSLAAWLASGSSTGFTRAAYLALMALALAAGLFTNYYCVLAFFPIAAGQAAADFRLRRIAAGVWAAMLAGAAPLPFLLPLIRHNIAEFAPHAWNRPRLSMVGLSYVELVEGVLWPTLLLAAFALRRRSSSLPLPARTALLTLLLYPVLGYLLALGGAGMISPRCVVPVCCGVGLLAGVAGAEVLGRYRHGMRNALVLLVLWFAVRESVCAVLLLQQRRAFLSLRNATARLDQSAPILVADSSLVLPLYFYSAPAVASRIVFPVDFDAIHAMQADDSGEENLWAGRKGVFPFPVVPFTPPPAGARDLVIARPDGWLASSLRASGASLTAGPFLPAWDEGGGVFTPMAHPETRFLFCTR